MSKPKYRREAEPEVVPCDYVPESEAEQSRREMREWLRDRPEQDWELLPDRVQR